VSVGPPPVAGSGPLEQCSIVSRGRSMADADRGQREQHVVATKRCGRGTCDLVTAVQTVTKSQVSEHPDKSESLEQEPGNPAEGCPWRCPLRRRQLPNDKKYPISRCF
jgi:hypothetical protein